MKIKDIFIKKLENVKYQNKKAFDYYGRTSDFTGFLDILEKDRDNVFHAIYGDREIQGRGTKKMKEWEYRLIEARMDLQHSYILMTMHYLLTQIKINKIKI